MNRKDHIEEVMRRYQAPFYFYDLDKLEDHLNEIKKHTSQGLKIFYATKANPLSRIMKLINSAGLGIDVASLGELKLAKEAGVKGKSLIATGPAKSKNYLASLLQAEVETIVVESFNQLKDLNEIAGRLGKNQDVLLRMQLAWEGEETFMGGAKITPFGLAPSDWQEINLKDYPHIKVKGIHCFQWGNILDLGELENIWVRTIKEARELASSMKFELDVMDLGGGIGIPYNGYSQKIEYKKIHDLLQEIRQNFEIKSIWLELGRYLVGEMGSYFNRVIDKKTTRNKNLLVLEGGINHMSRGALVHESFPANYWGEILGNIRRYSLHGPLCTSLDTLGEADLPESIKVCDWIEFKMCGAYGFTESMPYFLCHGLAGEAFTHQGELFVPRVPHHNLEWMV